MTKKDEEKPTKPSAYVSSMTMHHWENACPQDDKKLVQKFYEGMNEDMYAFTLFETFERPLDG